MVRNINEDRRSDIIAARDAWDANYTAKKKAYARQEREYEMALAYISKYVENYVTNAIGDTTLNLDIRVSPWGGDVLSSSYNIKITSDDFNKFDENVALSWSWSAYINKEGKLVKDSSSWSGLKATTSEQLDSLTETLRILKVLNGIDWESILNDANRRRPSHSDYIDVEVPWHNDRPNFEQQLKEAEIENIVGKPILIQASGNRYKGNDIWFLIVAETPKQYKVVEFAPYTIKSREENGSLKELVMDILADKKSAEGISKDRFLSKVPNNIVTKEV